MKILVAGSGGREHALAWKLSQEAEVIAAPGNPGIAEVATCFPVPVTDTAAIIELAMRERVDLVVIGPEDPLIAGLADKLRRVGFDVFGPGADGANLEASKAFSKRLMQEAGVPTARFETFSDPTAAHAYVTGSTVPLVVKASGAALGKGVIVCANEAEAHEAVDAMLIEQEFGAAGDTIVIEDRLNGEEFSLLTLCSDGRFFSLPAARDHKRALDGDRGPNTGGMGTISPVPGLSPDLVRQTEKSVVEPILKSLEARGISYRGVLFSGLMLHDGVPHCLEFNVRFGDPETQSVMLRLGSGFTSALLACAKGEEIPPIEIKQNCAATVVVASGGYPGSYDKGLALAIGQVPDGVQVFHAGTARVDGQLATSGGRVLSVSATGATPAEARASAYDAVNAIQFERMHYRRDIGA